MNCEISLLMEKKKEIFSKQLNSRIAISLVGLLNKFVFVFVSSQK